MAALKCPNPSCPFLFDPTQVPPGALLTCPRCGMRFTLGPTPGQAPPGYPPPQMPAGYPGAPGAGYYPPPPAPNPNVDFSDATYGTIAPVEEPTPTEPAQAREKREAPRPKRGGSIGPTIMAIGGVLLVLGVIAAVVIISMMMRRGITQSDTVTTGEISDRDKNFAFKLPGGSWERDAETQSAMNVTVIALHRTEAPEAWVAFSVSDFKDRSPMQHELRDKMNDHLQRTFDNLPAELPLEPATWGQHKNALKCQFRGTRKNSDTVCVGECYMLAYKGIGYWAYTWAAERDYDAVHDELQRVREMFRTMNERDKWTDRVGNKVTYPRRGNQKYRYQLSNYEKIWNEPPGLVPTDEDPKADSLLKAELRNRNKQDRPPAATLVVMAIDDGGDPMTAAGTYVKKRHSPDPEVFGPTQITELTGEPAGDPPIGEEATAIAPVRLKVSPGGANASKSAEKLVVYAAIRSDNKVIIAEANCPWTQREIWERRLNQLVGSLQGN